VATRTAKEFLLQECSNLQGVLEETLRFKYGLEGSKEFFEECQSRLTYIRQELEQTSQSEFDRLQLSSFLLNQLSDLISRIERSSIGEYSWPFVEELKKIAVATCTEATAADPNTKPQFHVWSSGGLDAYAIQPEPSRPSGSRKRIHTIVLPKTLKHSVLLHSILGHEVGHAMFRCSKHQSELNAILRDLLASTVFENPIATANWLYSNEAPDRIKRQLASPMLTNVTPANFFTTVASWHAWMEEILCDFIGLVTFGPSFLAAESNLLYAMDPSGTGVGPRHPPVGCRINYLLAAAHLGGLSENQYEDQMLNSCVSNFWSDLRSREQTDPWFEVFPEMQIEATIKKFTGLFSGLEPALYVKPAEDELKTLINQLARLVPPVGFAIDANQTMSWRRIDFRNVLYAGWITAANHSSIPFTNLNRLCEHAIMQQRAIEIEMGGG
jgi:hypothetical protein